MTSHFKKADRAGARMAVIVGDNERAEGKLLLRDLLDRTQQEVDCGQTTEMTATLVLEAYGRIAAASSGKRAAI